MSLVRKGSAEWFGTGLEGNGMLHSPSGLLHETPYTLGNRFENESGEAGTNPEELIAAAHAGCFCMALSFQVVAAGFRPKRLAAEAVIHMQQEGFDWSFESIELQLEAEIDGIDADRFEEIARLAKDSCPVSMALAAVPINLKTRLL